MQLLIGNTLGFWALLGVPIVLIIHALQQRAKRVPCSTLFLLEDLAPESVRGPVVEALRPSWLLLLQLLAVCLLCWLLVEPRWVAPDSKRVVAIVLDSSVSMSSFRPNVEAAVTQQIARATAEPGVVEWALIDSRRSGSVLYRGSELTALRHALARWEPSGGHHDVLPAVHYAREIAGKEGLAICVTDHKVALPPSVALLAVGVPRENCGFAGALVDEGSSSFRALLRNYGDLPCERTMSLGARAEKIMLASGEMRAIEGSIPAGAEGIRLELSPDGFTADDSLSVVRPERRVLRVVPPSGVESPERQAISQWWVRLSATVGRLVSVPVGERGDLFIGGEELLQTANGGGAVEGNAIAFVGRKRPGVGIGRVFSEHHPLVENLRWDDLRATAIGAEELRSGDEPLVWSGEVPLIFLRPTAHGQTLVINLMPEGSNLSRNSSFVLLMHRFIEQVRSGGAGAETILVETNQRLRFSASGERFRVEESDAKGVVIRSRELAKAALAAPSHAGFFSVKSDKGELTVKGAAQFAEVVEADLRSAASFDGTAGLRAHGREQRTMRDPFTSLWLLLLLAVLLGSWKCAAAEGPR